MWHQKRIGVERIRDQTHFTSRSVYLSFSSRYIITNLIVPPFENTCSTVLGFLSYGLTQWTMSWKLGRAEVCQRLIAQNQMSLTHSNRTKYFRWHVLGTYPTGLSRDSVVLRASILTSFVVLIMFLPTYQIVIQTKVVHEEFECWFSIIDWHLSHHLTRSHRTLFC